MSTDNKSTLADDWPEASQFKRSIRLEIALYVCGIMFLAMLMAGYVISDRYVGTVTRNVVDKLLVQARSYSGPAGKLMISGERPDALLLNNVCARLAEDNEDVHWVGITDDHGVFIAHTDIKQVIVAARMGAVRADQFDQMLRTGEGFSLRGDTVYISVPITENEVDLGGLAVAASARPIGRARTTSIFVVGSITALVLVGGIPAMILLLRRKLRPISVITDNLKHIDFARISFDIPVHSKNELGFLAETLRVMGSKLNAAQRELLDKERMARELEIAREIQANILPRTLPRGDSFGLAVTYRSAREVGGDYYDFIDYDGDNIGLLVADVSGKSLPGMLVMLLTRDIVKRIALRPQDPSRVLAEVNEELLPSIRQGMFVTMFFGILEKTTGRFSFASAGHNPLILLRRDAAAAELVKTRGFPLGMVKAEMYERRVESGEVVLAPGDWLIQYTDGVNEANNGNGEEFGMERFTRLIEDNRGLEPDALVQAVLAGHSDFVGDTPQYDDITLLAVKWTGPGADILNKRQVEGVHAR
jgi:serine phosphatase RsbU (regulator of sigma subunit)